MLEACFCRVDIVVQRPDGYGWLSNHDDVDDDDIIRVCAYVCYYVLNAIFFKVLTRQVFPVADVSF